MWPCRSLRRASGGALTGLAESRGQHGPVRRPGPGYASGMAIKSTADKIATIQKGYTLEGPTIELGAAIIDGELRKEAPVRLPLAMMNRHGLVAGATGTGKTVGLHMMAEQLSTAGVPVFLADIKGDLSGLATAATGSENSSRARKA